MYEYLRGRTSTTARCSCTMYLLRSEVMIDIRKISTAPHVCRDHRRDKLRIEIAM